MSVSEKYVRSVFFLLKVNFDLLYRIYGFDTGLERAAKLTYTLFHIEWYHGCIDCSQDFARGNSIHYGRRDDGSRQEDHSRCPIGILFRMQTFRY